MHKTMEEVRDTQRRELRDDLQRQKREWDEANPSSVPHKFKLSEYFVENPE